MKALKRIVLGLLILLAAAVVLLLVSGNDHILRGLPSTYLRGENRPDIDDLPYVKTRVIEAGEARPLVEDLFGELEEVDRDFLDSLRTAAFLVMHCDTLIFEYYGAGFDASSAINSFSMAKSFTSLAVGAAADAGLLDYDDPVSKYLPRFSEGLNARLSIRHLLQMRSNIDFGESYYDPFGYQAKAYFGTDLLGITAPYRVDAEPGTEWKYEGGNTVILSEIVSKVTGMTLSEWFSQSVWQAIGAEADAQWNIDREGGQERVFSAVYARPRDFLRLGQMLAGYGQLGGRKILSQAYFTEALRPVNTPGVDGERVEHYGFQWWLAPPNYEPWHFSARGMRGQYIVVLPEEDLVIVRMGHDRLEGSNEHHMTPDLPVWVEMGLKLRNQHAERH